MEQNDLISFVSGKLRALGVAHYVTGSIASGIYGESRTTNDIDMVADLSSAHVASLIAEFPESSFYLSRDAVEQAIRTRSQFNIIDKETFVKVDVILPKDTPAARTRLERRQERTVAPDVRVPVASPEDVIVMKLVYFEEGGSERQLRDVAGILQNDRITLDEHYIRISARAMGVEEAWDVVTRRVRGDGGAS